MDIDIPLALTEPQEQFVFSDARFPLFCGGFGAGKSEALVTRALLQKLAYPNLDQGYFAPTFDLVRLIAWPRFLAKLDEWRIPHKPNKADRVIYIKGAGSIICRTMDNPDAIVGFEIADATIDELDTLKEDHARNAWNKIIARCRQRKPDRKINTAAVGTTPEGFRFAYKQWAKDKKAEEKGYVLIRAPTSSNPMLPLEYIQSLKDTYPANLLDAYLNGLFVNLTSGAVYPGFDRKANHGSIIVNPGEPLHVGMDFNAYNMAAIIFVVRHERPFAVGEITKGADTPAVCKSLKERFAGHPITVYPDASGQAVNSKNSSVSDLAIIQGHGFAIRVGTTNPFVRDRVLAMNGQILDQRGHRNLVVDTDACPAFTEALEQQVYDKNGDPDKASGHDHAADAGGYFISTRFPVLQPQAAHEVRSAHMGR